MFTLVFIVIFAVVIGVIIYSSSQSKKNLSDREAYITPPRNTSFNKSSGYQNTPPLPHSVASRSYAKSKKYTINYDGRAETGQQYPFNIVGEASYQNNIARSAILRTGRDCFTEVEAIIRREPNNAYDKNACRVDVNNLTVGYFAKNHAESWVKLLDKLDISENSKIYVRAVIVGGGDGRHFGVRLDMPERVASTAKYIEEIN